jgi:hypothetical protein
MTVLSDGFSEISPGVGVGGPLPDGWVPVTDCECLVLVGLTGVGKSTVLSRLSDGPMDLLMLPDRRALTDLLMIPYVQRMDGLPVEPVRDRTTRFDLTRRYRQRFAGGMAHAMSGLSLSRRAAARAAVFDGLRGANEVSHAAELMPQARFLMLDAPDWVRIQRLVSRRDGFDSVASSASSAGSGTVMDSLAALGVSELLDIVDDTEASKLMDMVRDGTVSVDELAATARIVAAERRNYDPTATQEALVSAAPERTLVVDTSVLSPDDIVQRTVQWLEG